MVWPRHQKHFYLRHTCFKFDEKVMEYVITGDFATAFSQSLDNSTNLTSLSISAPFNFNGLLSFKARELATRWLKTVESISLRASCRVERLEELVIKRDVISLLAVPMSGL